MPKRLVWWRRLLLRFGRSVSDPNNPSFKMSRKGWPVTEAQAALNSRPLSNAVDGPHRRV